MKQEVLKLLKEADGFLSGQSICDSLGVSRTAVWKVVNQLKEEGYQIRSVRNRGYLLDSFADVMTEAELASSVRSRWCGREIHYFPETDSTNIQAKRLAELGASHGCLVVADSQTAGRGRRGRHWSSEPGGGIFMSLILRPPFSPESASMVTLVAALAVSEGIFRSTGERVLIKWPNDLVCHRKKLCGILTEMSTEIDRIHYVVVGMGINVNTETFPEELDKQATSLRLLTGKPIQRSQIAASVLEQFETYYETFVEQGDLSPFLDRYQSQLVCMGETIRVLLPREEFQGVAEGIDPTGALKVRLRDGTCRLVVSGEVSIRTADGYI